MKFITYLVADVSTRHITKTDAELLSLGGTGFRVGEIDAGRGHLVMVPERTDDWEPELRNAGYSDAFIALLAAAARQEIPYIRFDADGYDVEGAPVFDW